MTSAGVVLVYSHSFRARRSSDLYGIAVDGAGSAYITGYTESTNFPTQSPYQATFQGGVVDAFVTKLTQGGNVLVYSTYLGGGSADDYGLGIAVDRAGSAYVTGRT